MNYPIFPAPNYILVEPVEPDVTTKQGLVIAPNLSPYVAYGRVVGYGEMDMLHEENSKMNLRKGLIIIYSPKDAKEFQYPGVQLVLLNEMDVLAALGE